MIAKWQTNFTLRFIVYGQGTIEKLLALIIYVINIRVAHAYKHDLKVGEILISFIFPVNLVFIRMLKDIKLTE